MTFSFIFFTISIKKRSYTEEELKSFIHSEQVIEDIERLRNNYYSPM
ncbi:uncharacterized protein (TIGR02413 family) [Alkalihalobacillus xiaoxiensis]|uniref:Uncharacterized protein (TIGR02413 family) n=1 Tax=Shouchella xiaoxiensis TaxID=766895 RepID=A0ABS2SR38_9BACI|nr:YrzI family small protein [Shouchella xiaoxiensis]MBM7837978.1 uncharacterized protein (TIGR02413 family) [Shouchella xiaoxiensis]